MTGFSHSRSSFKCRLNNKITIQTIFAFCKCKRLFNAKHVFTCMQDIFISCINAQWLLILTFILLRGNCTPNQNWACFVHYFKVINTDLKNNISILKHTEKLKICIEMLAVQIFLELTYCSKQYLKVLIHNERTAWPTEISMPFWVPQKICFKMLFFTKSVDNNKIMHKTCSIFP